MKRQHGATVLDLLKWILAATIAVWSSVVIVNVMSEYQKTQTVSVQAKQLLVDFIQARKYAIEHNAKVVMCPVSPADVTHCGTDWQNGWVIVGLAQSQNNQALPLRIKPNDSIIKKHQPLEKVNIDVTLNDNLVVFNATGIVNQGPYAKISICGIENQEFSNELYFRSEGRAEMVVSGSCE